MIWLSEVKNLIKTYFGGAIDGAGNVKTISTAGTDGLDRLANAQDQGNNFRQITTEHDKVHSGVMYDFWHDFTLTGTTPQHLLLRTGNRQMHLIDRQMSADKDSMILLVCGLVETADIVELGSPVTVDIRRRTLMVASTTTASARTVASFTGGEKVDRILQYGTPSSGVGSNARPATGEQHFAADCIPMPANSNVLVSINHFGDETTIKATCRFMFYEVGLAVA